MILFPVPAAATMSSGGGETDADRQVEVWRVKKLIKSLQNAQGSGTSMISLLIPPGGQISRTNAMLTEEYGTASNIKSRVNRLSVLDAITSAQQKLKLFNKVPTNGLVLYTGTVQTEEGKEKRMAIAFEPLKPINKSFYLCDSKFHTEALEEMLEDDERFGFIVMDGSGTLYGTVQGNNREILHKFSVDLPKKHGRGGQSAVRFARLRMEKRHNYVRKVAELAVQYFIHDNRPNVGGLVMAGSADFKTELQTSGLFDPRLQKVVLQTVDVSYGGEQGFNQAIELAANTLGEVKLVQEKKLLQRFFDEISQDTGKFCFGVDETLKALDLGAVENLIVWEALETIRYTVRDKANQEERVLHISKQQAESGDTHLRDPVTNQELEVVDKMPLVEWLADNYKRFGASLEMVTDRSQEGAQFCRGFGGVGGILRWKVDFDDGMGYDPDAHAGIEVAQWDDDDSPF